jgi:[NiFe] hydrogenase diaphorase moiety large subunit
VPERQFDRRICYEDLGTGGAFMVLGADRDLLASVQNHMEFFANETCGFCVPCRAGNTLLLKALQKIRAGHGTTADLTAIEHLGAMVKTASRCGLGQTSPNPLLSTLEHFREVYLGSVRADVDYLSQFDLDAATAESVAVASGTPSVEQG